MKKKVKKSVKRNKGNPNVFTLKHFVAAIVIIVLLLAAVLTGLKTGSFMGVALGVVIGFLLTPLFKQVGSK